MTTIKAVYLADALDRIANRITLLQLACDGLDHADDAPIIGQELFKLAQHIKALSGKISPINVEDEIACAQRSFDRQVERIKEAAEREANADEALKELEGELEDA